MSGNQIRRRRIQPKLHSIPASKSASAIYIQMHQLATERERLHQELVRISDRQDQIIKRLQELDQGLNQLETTAANNTTDLDLSQVDPAVAALIEAKLNQSAQTQADRNHRANNSKATNNKQSQAKKRSSNKANNDPKNDPDYSSMTIEY
ncbi:hypothetical protein Pse7367_0881 [Thalassoporum mexicanum PCC 7367]|uniref:hypothetical protein n=1 Tax=Thalassoporum mexicanum TaxID=3457544 RepID=UPI00029FDCBE|nr:hypothetical protein [Pseudanabaena sp. PCC 7367]AFY69181.1 hypothetical protein Pse7367_0881 [Pseudanabaena sp. PCC 7367]